MKDELSRLLELETGQLGGPGIRLPPLNGLRLSQVYVPLEPNLLIIHRHKIRIFPYLFIYTIQFKRGDF